MACACKNCASAARPAREEMTLISGDADREIRAARVGHMLIIEAYDSDGAGGWDRDPEYGVAVSEPGFEALRKLLGVEAHDLEETMVPKIDGGSPRA